MMFAYSSDAHCQHSDQQNQIYKFSPKSDLFQFLQSIIFLFRLILFLFQQLSCFFVSQRLTLDAVFCQKQHFDDFVIISAELSDVKILGVNFKLFLVKWSTEVILAKNYENILKFVNVMFSKP